MRCSCTYGREPVILGDGPVIHGLAPASESTVGAYPTRMSVAYGDGSELALWRDGPSELVEAPTDNSFIGAYSTGMLPTRRDSP